MIILPQATAAKHLQTAQKAGLDPVAVYTEMQRQGIQIKDDPLPFPQQAIIGKPYAKGQPDYAPYYTNPPSFNVGTGTPPKSRLQPSNVTIPKPVPPPAGIALPPPIPFNPTPEEHLLFQQEKPNLPAVTSSALKNAHPAYFAQQQEMQYLQLLRQYRNQGWVTPELSSGQLPEAQKLLPNVRFIPGTTKGQTQPQNPLPQKSIPPPTQTNQSAPPPPPPPINPSPPPPPVNPNDHRLLAPTTTVD